MASSSDNDHELAAILNSHKPEGSQDSDLPAWIQAHVSTSAGAAEGTRQQDQEHCRMCLQPGISLNDGCQTKQYIWCVGFATQTPVKVQIAISDDSDQATAPDRTAGAPSKTLAVRIGSDTFQTV